jgi:hypothetical protein
MTTKERAKLRDIVGRLQVILEDLEALHKDGYHQQKAPLS